MSPAGIMQLAASEAMLFKYGSGTGTDLSTLRSSREKLSGGGTPSASSPAGGASGSGSVCTALFIVALLLLFRDAVYGASAGAINGAFFVAGQTVYATRIYWEDINSREFIVAHPQ